MLDGDLDTVATVDMGAYETDVTPLAVVINLTQSTSHATFADAMALASDGDELIATVPAFLAEPDVDFLNKALALRSAGTISQAAGGTYTMADDSALAARIAGDINLHGALEVDFGDRVEIRGDSVHVVVTGSVAFPLARWVRAHAPHGFAAAAPVAAERAGIAIADGAA